MRKLYFGFFLALMALSPVGADATLSFYGSSTFHGLFFPADGIAFTNSGAINLTMTAGQKYTARVRLAGASYSLSGALSQASMDFHTLHRPQLTVGLRLQGSGLVGTISNQSWVAQIHADQAFYDGKGNIAPQKGRYTLALAGTNGMPLLPAGYGYCTLNANSAGRATLVGSLADGTKISQSAIIAETAQAPLYCVLNGGKGSLLGWLTFQTNREVRGPVFWFKPASPKGVYPSGFSWLTSIQGLPYNPPAKGINVFNSVSLPLTLSLNGGGFTSASNYSLVLNHLNAARDLNKGFSLTVSPSTGLLKGVIPDPIVPGKKLSFSGIVLQNEGRGLGFFLGNKQSGAVLLGNFDPQLGNLAPQNDDFENRIRIDELPATVLGSDVNATTEPGEPGWVPHTVWWSWTAPTTCQVGIFLADCSTPLNLNVYTGDTLANLASVSLTNIYSGWYLWPASVSPSVIITQPLRPLAGVAFEASAGTIYQFQCSAAPAPGDLSEKPVTGPLQFTIAPPPPNDNFSNRLALDGDDIITNMPALLATGEPFETNSYGHSIWWSWTAPTNGTLSLVAVSGNVSIFTGESVNDLMPQDVVRPVNNSTNYYLDAVANTTYQIEQDGSPGNYDLQLHFQANRYYLGVYNWTTMGSLIASPTPGPDGLYPAGTVVTLTAIPAEGYQFFGWQFSLTSPSATIEVLMDRSYALFADFGQ